MNRNNKKFFSRTGQVQAGMALIETVVALGLLLVVAASVAGLAAISMTTTENQGHLQARTAEYAQDKMEQLLALTFCDGPSPNGTDTTVYPAVAPGGTGLAGCTPGNPPTPLTGGGLNINAPVAGYVDYVDVNGNPSNAAGNWQYIRVWQVSVPAGSNLVKQISVLCQVRTAAGGKQLTLPNTTVVALKSFPF